MVKHICDLLQKCKSDNMRDGRPLRNVIDEWRSKGNVNFDIQQAKKKNEKRIIITKPKSVRHKLSMPNVFKISKKTLWLNLKNIGKNSSLLVEVLETFYSHYERLTKNNKAGYTYCIGTNLEVGYFEEEDPEDAEDFVLGVKGDIKEMIREEGWSSCYVWFESNWDGF